MTSGPDYRSTGSPQSNGSLPQHLYQRGQTYYFKRRIPQDVAVAFPGYQGQIWKSLRTGILVQARVRLAVEVAAFDMIVARHRQQVAQTALHALPDSKASSRQPLATKAGYISRHSRGEHVQLESFSSVPRPVQGKASPMSGITAKADSNWTTTIEHLLEDWKRKQSNARTINAVATTVAEFTQLHSALSVRQITRTHARAFRDNLTERQLSKGTIVNKLGFLATLVRHGMNELVEDLALNPFERIEVIGDQRMRAVKDRRAYELGELNRIFKSKLYSDHYRPKGQVAEAAYWLPILGPFVGARIEELCQARVEDVQCVNGVWCIRICDLGDDQKVKTESSFRRVPLHESVIKSGFLVFVARIAAGGHDRIFPSLSNKNANGVFSNAAGKWFGRYLETVGLDDPRLDYHSFRYTFRQQCSLCGIDNETRDALTGHWLNNSDAGRTYMRAELRQYPFPKLVAAVRQLRYDELNIDHLTVPDPLEGTDRLLR